MCPAMVIERLMIADFMIAPAIETARIWEGLRAIIMMGRFLGKKTLWKSGTGVHEVPVTVSGNRTRPFARIAAGRGKNLFALVGSRTRQKTKNKEATG